MASRNAYETLAKKDLIQLYDISYPTLRRWLRRAGLAVYIGRKKLKINELVTIFQHLGLPHLARTATQRLKDIYFRMRGMLSDQNRYKELYGKDMPKVKQDLLPPSEEEKDHPSTRNLEQVPSNSPLHIWDAICRLTCVAIQLKGLKAVKKQASNKDKIIPMMKSKKRVNKRKKRAA